MKRKALKLAVISTLGLTSASVFAAFVTLPPAGSPVPANFNYPGSPAGTTAYVLCNTSGDFGSLPTTPPSSSSDACAVFPASETTSPEPGFNLITGANRPITVNNIYTGGARTIGNVQEYVWRNTAATECIYGAKVVLTSTASADYLPASGTQYFEVNDIARGGFSGRPVAIAYYYASSTSEVLFRAGLTHTAVQHRSGVPQFAELPLTTPVHTSPVHPSIVGVDALPLSTVPTAAQQAAPLNDNWVTFTTDANVQDDDGTSKAHSSLVYVKTTCNSSAPVALAGAIRIRQTFQELNGDGVSSNRFIEVAVPGFAPPGAVITPAHTDPF